MKPEQTAQPDYNQPVAYDAQGRPLYAHPPVVEPPRTLTQPAVEKIVQVVRSVDPIKKEVSDEVKKRHDRSRRLYPDLNLSEHEYVISAIRRHPIGLIIPIIFGVLLITVALTILSNYAAIVEGLNIQGQMADVAAVTVPILLFCLVVALGLYVVYYVYTKNRFYLTNESIIQQIQVSLFSQHEQTVSLGNVEDASYYQEGVFQQLVNYGTIRLSTQGDENTYRFTYVSNPKQHLALLNNAVESFKNGRLIED